MANIGLKISKGENVFSASVDELSFNSKYKQFKFLPPIDDTTIVNATGLDIPDEYFIYHNEGFEPAFISFIVDFNFIYRLPAEYPGTTGALDFRLYMGSNDENFFDVTLRAAGSGNKTVRTLTFYSESERLD